MITDTGMTTVVAPNPKKPNARPTSAGLSAAPRLPPTENNDIARPRPLTSPSDDSAAAGGWNAADPSAASSSKPDSAP